MNLYLAFTRTWYVLPLGWLFLADYGVSSAIAEDTFTGVPPDTSSLSLVAKKKDLTLEEALYLALQHNPELAVFDKEVRALEGTILQAGLLRNPELSVNVDNAGNMGNGQRPGTSINPTIKENVEQQDLIVRVSQLIELGGKRAARVHAASLGQQLAGKDYETKRLELAVRVANGFIEVLAGQEQLKLAEESQQLAQRVVDTVSKRVQAAKVPPIEETKIGVAFSATRIALGQAQRELTSARKRLALLWGDSLPEFGKVLGDLQASVTLPTYEALVEFSLSSPMADRARKGIEHREALLEVERAQRVPNITIGGRDQTLGIRRHHCAGWHFHAAAVIRPESGKSTGSPPARE
ncbi:outer membrane protein, cobalt-zinc-cadmium efflux system [Nitrosospira multiformis]|uniref:Outer membrane protein, cobalt-zinc-cadmium efflux system n=1 Tax=Nitrosospira multiformis TaxID=1231 RepID=A0A1I0G8C5_9PROT|nr:TolC family protein [Nitrosospira multiformis]SET67074.1 outer membrane protein, cobalt-zinc-cadmium efflux system [Nitrosospira multiformis]